MAVYALKAMITRWMEFKLLTEMEFVSDIKKNEEEYRRQKTRLNKFSQF